jgi:hypothetical protein
VHLCNIALLGTTIPMANEAQADVSALHHRYSIPSFAYTDDGQSSSRDEYPSGYIMTGAASALCAMAERALPYQEPGITTLLTLSSFLYLLNVINHLLDKWIYCGLLGQVFVGVAWGMPGAQWISKAIQGVFTQLGFLGLVLLVYEGMIAAPLVHRLIG